MITASQLEELARTRKETFLAKDPGIPRTAQSPSVDPLHLRKTGREISSQPVSVAHLVHCYDHRA